MHTCDNVRQACELAYLTGNANTFTSLKFTACRELTVYYLIFYQTFFFPKPEFNYILYIETGKGNGTPLQYSCLENPMDGGAWKAAVHGVADGRTRLSNFPFTFHFHALKKEMATHSSVLAWRIPGTGKPGGLPSMRSHRVGHD